jgi:uncharacterized protein (UPF0218 family)
MAVLYRVTPELRVKLKDPFGILIQGSFAETIDGIEKIVAREKPPMIVSVGDRVSRNLHERRMNPQLSVIDNKCMRKRIEPRVFGAEKVVHVKNPQGTITEGAIAAIRAALESDRHVQISLVVYGQPYEGIVVVRVTSEKKAEAMEILKAMKIVRKAK